jgi:DNA polymerase III epsilon subunit-like protein
MTVPSLHPDAPPDPWGELCRLAAEPFVILDTETTGLLAPEVVSIAVVDDRGRSLLHQLVRPEKQIEPGAARLTGLSLEALEGKPSFLEIAPSVADAIRGRRVVIYNAAYDVATLENTHRRYGLDMPAFESWCAMEWFARIHGQWDPERSAFVWQSLAKAAAFFGVRVETAHNALADCMTTWHILQEARRRSGLRHSGMDSLF